MLIPKDPHGRHSYPCEAAGCGGAMVIETGYCRPTAIGLYDAACDRCGREATAYGTGDSNGPFFSSWEEARRSRELSGR